MSRLHKFCRCERARARLRGANASKACRLHADRQLDLRSQIRRLPCFGAAWRERDANPIAQPEDRRRLSGTRLFTENIDLLLTRVRELSLKGLIAKRAGSKYDSKRSGAWIKLYQRGSFVSAAIPNLPANGNTWARCWSVSMKTQPVFLVVTIRS
jgi:hypothetical protein